MPKDFPRAPVKIEQSPSPVATGGAPSPYSHRPGDNTPSKGGAAIMPQSRPMPGPVKVQPIRRPGARKR